MNIMQRDIFADSITTKKLIPLSNNFLLTRVTAPMEDELAIELCVFGYPVCSDIWEAAVEEELLCEHEPRNAKDSYA